MSDTQDTLDQARYREACHAVQSGVAAKMEYDSKETEPKHLRTGVNIAMRDHASLVYLLVGKGIITMAEFQKAIADGMETEKQLYEAALSAHFGAEVKLH